MVHSPIRKGFSQRLQDPDQAAEKHSQGELGEQVTPHSMTAKIDRAHIELIQQVQHELRTPVHGLLGTLEELRQDLRSIAIEDRGKKNSVMVKMDSLAGLADRLQHVLDDFRDFATETIIAREAEENHQVQPEEAVDLGELLDTVASEAWSAQVRQIRADRGEDARLPPPPELILQTETSLQGWKTVVSTDLVRRLAHKLISNALRFTKEGYVEVSLAPAVVTPGTGCELSLDSDAPTASQNFVELVVEDTGEGMTEDFLSHRLFQPFVKADKFKAGAGLSMTLCSSLVRRMGGAMHVSSDVGRGTVVTVRIPVQTLPGKIVDSAPPSQSDQLIYLYGFEGWGLQRLAQVISAQLATFGNLYCTSHIEDADYLLLPEKVCADVDGGIEAILERTKPGVKIGVLQAHEDAGIEYAALKNGSRRPTFVTRKPFGPRCFANLLRLAEQTDAVETRDPSEFVRDQDGHLGYVANVDPKGKGQGSDSEKAETRQSSLPRASGLVSPSAGDVGVGPLDALARARMEQPCEPERADGSTSGEAAASAPADQGAAEAAPQKRGDRPRLVPSKGDKLADLVVSPGAMDRVLRAPNPLPRMQPPSTSVKRREGSTAAADETEALPLVPPPLEFSVLCCEDNPLNMRILTTMLRQSSILFYEAVDGVEAVEQFVRHRPAVTLLDINMPRMMGFEACELMRKHVARRRRRLRSQGKDDATDDDDRDGECRDDADAEADADEDEERMYKIVAVTALSDDFHKQKGLACGMDEWLSKPLKMRGLKASLSEWKQEFDHQQAKQHRLRLSAALSSKLRLDDPERK